MDQKIIVALVVVLALAVGGYFIWTEYGAPKTTQQSTESNTTQTNQTNEIVITTPEIEVTVTPPAQIKHTVTYTDNGFSPAELTIKVGETVVFANNSSSGMWVGSAMHPNHVGYSGTALQQHCPDLENDDFDQCANGAAGTSWSFTFTKAGSWGYHNHSNSKHFGKVIVQ